jgi:hypothetical protein
MPSRPRSRSYAWALHSELSDSPNALSERAWQGLEYARELARQAPLRSRQALRNQPALEPHGERQLAAQEGISLAVLRTRIARARAELFGSLSDSGIYKRKTRRRLQRARAFKGRPCTEPTCQASLPSWARSNRRYCDLHASPRARTQRHRAHASGNQPPPTPARRSSSAQTRG